MNRWTQLVHFDPAPGDPYHANVTPIYQTATFAQEEPGVYGKYDYSRSGNPTRTIVEQQIARLENARYGFCFTSGMAALTAIVGLFKQGDHIIASDDLYGGTHRLLAQRLSQRGISVSLTDTSDLASVKRVLNPATKLILIETPSNPLQKISPIQSLAHLIHEQGGWLLVDNTFLSPWLQQPLTLEADLVLHSATKHLAGHSDVTAGVIVTNNEKIAEQIAFIQNAEGSALAPFDSWLLLRGIKTLGLRIERQQSSAEKIACYLQQHPQVVDVYYPAISGHPGAFVHAQQAKGGGTIIGFTSLSFEKSLEIVKRSRIFTTSVSFGSLSSLISMPTKMSHAAMHHDLKLFAASMIRLSIGIEDPNDLIEDLEQALNG